MKEKKKKMQEKSKHEKRQYFRISIIVMIMDYFNRAKIKLSKRLNPYTTKTPLYIYSHQNQTQ